MAVDRPPNIITTLGLGSCLGITLCDRTRKIGGMVHIMLPACTGAGETNKLKFADTGIVNLLEAVVRNGGSRNNLVAKIAGGAHMFSNSHRGDVIKVGQRNAVSARSVLRSLKIPIIAEDIGGTYGRTIELNIATGELMVKTIGHGIKTI